MGAGRWSQRADQEHYREGFGMLSTREVDVNLRDTTICIDAAAT